MTDTRQRATWRFDTSTRGELRALAPDVTVLVPLGSTEQHGHHLPVLVDTAIVTKLAERAAEKASERVPVLVTPTLPFGMSEHHIPLGGTISLGAQTYIDVLVNIGRSLEQQGFRRIAFLNGHGGNDAPMRVALDRLAYEPPACLHVAGASYWDLAAEALETLDLDSSLVPGHAGHFETSLMLVLSPDLVQLPLRPVDPTPAMPIATPGMQGATTRLSGRWQLSDGRTDDASLASSELGTRIFEAVVDRIIEFLAWFHVSATGSGSRSPATCPQVPAASD